MSKDDRRDSRLSNVIKKFTAPAQGARKQGFQDRRTQRSVNSGSSKPFDKKSSKPQYQRPQSPKTPKPAGAGAGASTNGERSQPWRSQGRGGYRK